MPTLRNDGGRYAASGLGDELHEWLPGVVREVSDAQAAYLLANQPRFSVVAVVAPTRKPPRTVQKLPDLSNARQIVQDVQLGKLDALLSGIASKEGERSKPRRSVLKAIKERLEFIRG